MKSHEKSNMYEYVDGINKFEQAIMKMDFQCFLVQTLLKHVAGNKNKMRDEFVCWSAVCVELFFVFTSNTVYTRCKHNDNNPPNHYPELLLSK